MRRWAHRGKETKGFEGRLTLGFLRTHVRGIDRRNGPLPVELNANGIVGAGALNVNSQRVGVLAWNGDLVRIAHESVNPVVEHVGTERLNPKQAKRIGVEGVNGDFVGVLWAFVVGTLVISGPPSEKLQAAFGLARNAIPLRWAVADTAYAHPFVKTDLRSAGIDGFTGEAGKSGWTLAKALDALTTVLALGLFARVVARVEYENE